MSYCRWSSLNWMCDVYVYEDVSGGWTTHVAGRRRIIPPIPDVPLWRIPKFGGHWAKDSPALVYPSRWHARLARLVSWPFWFWHNHLHMRSLDWIPYKTLRMPGAGESFNDTTAAACADRLEQLRAVGFIVPQDAIDELRAESDQERTHAGGDIVGGGRPLSALNEWDAWRAELAYVPTRRGFSAAWQQACGRPPSDVAIEQFRNVVYALRAKVRAAHGHESTMANEDPVPCWCDVCGWGFER